MLDLPDQDTLHQALIGLPILRSLGGRVKVEVLPIRPYEAFAQDLCKAVAARGAGVA